MKILNFGSLNIDKVYQVDNFVRPGETISSKNLNFFCGGKGLNQSIALAKAGADVWHAGCIGNDGQMLSDALQDSQVHLDYLKTLDMPTGHALIQVSQTGQNCIILFGGANQTISREQIDETLSHFDQGDILLLQNEINNLPYLVDQAYEKGMTIFLNPSPITEQLKEIDLSKISYLVLNEIEAADLSDVTAHHPQDYADILLGKYPSCHILLTMGTAGSIYLDHQTHYEQSAYKVQAVDTTAAGDTYTGYFIAAIARGADVQAAMKEASMASAISVTRNGASTSIPERKEVLESL